MNLNPLALLEKAINEHGSSTILRERLSLVKETLEKVEREKAELEKELASLRTELADLRTKIPSSEFVSYRGVKFKRKRSGGYESTAYCPTCEVGMASVSSGGLPLVCGKCHSLSGFTAGELRSVLNELAIEFPP